MHTTGLIVVAVVLVVGTAAGLLRRRTDGRLRSVTVPGGGAGASAVDLSEIGTSDAGAREIRDPAVSAAVADMSDIKTSAEASETGGPGTGAFGNGGLGAGDGAADPSGAGVRLDPALLRALGVQPAPATLLQFSSAFCAPCRALRRVSGEVVALLPGVQHVEVDAESHLDAVRALGIWRTPTLLVLDADGRVVKRATGVPGKPQLIAVLGELLPTA
jgi:thiol-disulfide isomerase/thioredoxin